MIESHVFIATTYESPIPILKGESLAHQVTDYIPTLQDRRRNFRLEEQPKANIHELFPENDGPYKYILSVDRFDKATVQVIPKSRYDSNKYHAIMTPQGDLICRRGKAAYTLGYSVLEPHQFEEIGIVESIPRKGRGSRTAEFEMIGKVGIRMYEDPPDLEIRASSDISDLQQVFFSQVLNGNRQDIPLTSPQKKKNRQRR